MSEYDEYKAMFLEELREIQKQLNDMLLKLEKNPKDKDSLHEVMRAAHTVKGMAATMGYETLTTLSHAVEDILLNILKQEKFNPKLIDYLFEFSDTLQEYHDKIKNNQNIQNIPYQDIIAKLKAAAEEEEIVAETEELPEIRLGEKYQIIVEFTQTTKLKAARALLVIKNIETIANIIESKPTLDAIEEGEYFDKLELEIITSESKEALEKAVKSVQDVKKVIITQLMEDVEPEVIMEEKTEQKVGKLVGRKETIQTVRVQLSQLDYILDLLGELLQSSGRIIDSLGSRYDPVISEQIGNIERNIVDIQSQLMKMRMVTLTHILDRIPRMVRDIAKEQNKKVNVIVRGSHLELDRSVIDQLNEAILHLVRNAVHHGIETPSVRKKAGKTETGKIIIDAKQDRSEIVVTIEDDGQGINFEKVRQRAIEMGLITPDEPVTRADLLDFLFYEGFSTSTKADLVGGRGVGLDIVEKVISEIDGTLQVETKEGKGTKFILRVPQTVAIISSLIIKAGNQHFALPLSNVEQIFKEDEVTIFTQEGKEVAEVEDEIIPIVDLEQIAEDRFGPVKSKQSRLSQKPKLIYWYKGGQSVLLRVRELLGQREIVTKHITAYFQDFPGITGATVLGRERIALIIDPLGLYELQVRELA